MLVESSFVLVQIRLMAYACFKLVHRAAPHFRNLTTLLKVEVWGNQKHPLMTGLWMFPPNNLTVKLHHHKINTGTDNDNKLWFYRPKFLYPADLVGFHWRIMSRGSNIYCQLIVRLGYFLPHLAVTLDKGKPVYQIVCPGCPCTIVRCCLTRLWWQWPI